MSSTASNNSNNTVMEGCSEPPRMTVTLPCMKDIAKRSKDTNYASLPVDFLLLTVKDCEFLACYRQLVNPFRCWFHNVGHVYFDGIKEDGRVKVALIRCYEGSSKPGSSLVVVKNVATLLRPKAVISVGTCSSIDPQKAKLGDVVVSATLTSESSGLRVNVGKKFHDFIRHVDDGFEAPLQNPQARRVKIHRDGEFLSCQELVNSEWRRKQLAESHPSAIAIEMEGDGLFAAAHDGEFEWLVVKGIADYADGTESVKENWSPFASVMAASVVSHILDDSIAFRTWPHYKSKDALAVFGSPAQMERGKSQRGVGQMWVEHYAEGPFFDFQSSTNTFSGIFPSAAQVSQRTEGMTISEHHVGLSYLSHIIERIRQLYGRSEDRLVPVPWCDGLSFHVKDIFTRLRIVGKEKERSTLTDEITNLTGIFKAHKDCQNPQVVLIEGEPGMGKTTYCQKLAYDWATKQGEWDESFPSIEVLLLLRCHDTKSSIWEAIDQQIIPRDATREEREMFFKYIQENPSKVLFVFDGLDEVDSEKLPFYIRLMQTHELPGCYSVLTSRHEVGKKVRRYCDTLWEIVGFIKKDAISFIRKYFRNKPQMAEKLLKQIWPIDDWSPYLKDDSVDSSDSDSSSDGDFDENCDDVSRTSTDLRELTKNPLHATLLCALFEELGDDLPTKKTALFLAIVDCVLRRYEKKNELPSRKKEDCTLSSSYKDELVLLGRKAMQSLLKKEHCFEVSDDDDKFTILIKFGFLSIEAGFSVSALCNRYGFLHKNFQEFFAGFYLATQILDGKIDCDSVVNDKRYLDELSQVLLFMSGIVSRECDQTMESFVDGITSHVNSLDTPHVSEINSYLNLACQCISQCSSKDQSCKLLGSLGEKLRLETLKVRDVEPIEPLLEALTANRSLTDLDLSENGIVHDHAALLSHVLEANPSLTTLNLSRNNIGNSGAFLLSRVLNERSTLTTLNLSMNNIDVDGAASISSALKRNKSITNLSLSFNSIGAGGAAHLSEALNENSCLTNLNLREDSLGDYGAVFISNALKVNSTLTTLDLSWNRIGLPGIDHIFKALRENSSLTLLDLTGNRTRRADRVSLHKPSRPNTSHQTVVLVGDMGDDDDEEDEEELEEEEEEEEEEYEDMMIP